MSSSYFSKLSDSLNKLTGNKIPLILIFILIIIYYNSHSNNLLEKYICLFDNDMVKLLIFILISCLASTNPILAIILAIILLVNLQIITHLKLKEELNNDFKNINEKIKNENIKNKEISEKFDQINPINDANISDNYLKNPHQKINELAPPINFNLKLSTPEYLSQQMIIDGNKMLNDSLNIENDLLNRYDEREKQILFETKKTGKELLQSGINRLQGLNYYSNINSNNINNINKYDYLNEPMIKSIWDELLINYDLLKTKKMDKKNFDVQLDKIYYLEFKLLVNIYKLNKNKYPIEKQHMIDKVINNIKNLSNNKKNFIYEKLNKLTELIL